MDRVILGTVQFGMPYGFNRKSNMPSKKEVMQMLEYAWLNGIRAFDTARAYGVAEERLGTFIKTHSLEKEILITSKLTPNIFSDNKDKTQKIDSLIFEDIEKSLENLNMNSLYGIMLHTPEEIYEKPVLEALDLVREKGLVKKTGVSVYDMKDAFHCLKIIGKHESISLIQLPFSIFDQRGLKTDFFKKANDTDLEIHTRSCFLQGLILREKAPVKVVSAQIWLDRLKRILSDTYIHEGITPRDIPRSFNMPVILGLLFPLVQLGVNKLVFGVSSLDQLRENMAIIEEFEILRAEYQDLLSTLEVSFDDMKESVIFPSLWKKK